MHTATGTATAVAPPQRRGTRLAVALRVAGGGILLGLVLSQVDLSEMAARWDRRLLMGAVLAVGFLCLAHLLSAVRWRIVLGGGPLSLPYLCRLYFIGTFFSLFLPTSVGGDAVRALAASRSSGQVGETVSSVLVERFLGLGAMVVLLLTGLFAAPHAVDLGMVRLGSHAGAGLRAVLVASVISVLVLAFAARVTLRTGRGAQMVGEAVRLGRTYVKRPGDLGLATLTSLGVQTTHIAVWYSLATQMSLPLPAVDFLVLVPFVSLAAMLPVTLAGIGLREGAWILLLQPYGISSADALIFSLLYLVVLLLVGAAGAVAFSLWGLGLNSSTTDSSTAESFSQL